MSQSFPVTPLLSTQDFLVRARTFKDELVRFGLPGKEIIDHRRHTLIRPVPFIVPPSFDDAGVLLNRPLVQSHYDLSADKERLSDRGHSDYRYDITQYDIKSALWTKNSQELLQYILDHLSPSSKALLETKTGPDGYAAAKVSEDTFRVWDLIVETHLGVSSRSKYASFKTFLQLQQGALSLPDWLAIFRPAADTVLSHFGASGAHEGYIKFDDLARLIFLNGVNPTAFSRPIDRALEEFSDRSFSDLVEYFQAFAVERVQHILCSYEQ